MSFDTKVINLFGGPGTGKSTCCAGLFYQLKTRHVACEMATEFAKDIVWEGSTVILDNQIYVFANQHQRIHRLLGKVEYIITDSPLLLSLVYGRKMQESFHRLVYEEHKQMNNINVFLRRNPKKPFNPAGRLQTQERAIGLDHLILEQLNHWDITPLNYVDAGPDAPESIIKEILGL